MPKREDLTGRTYGRWKVLYYVGNKKWHCRCSCDAHTEKDVNAYTLTSGKSISCGCFAKEQRKESERLKEEKDLLGNTRGIFTAVEYVGDNNWKCKCNKCGNYQILERWYFLQGKLKSCHNCNDRSKPILNLVGETFGMWTVLEYAGYGKWKCRCDCGNISLVETSKLTSGDSKHCKKHEHKKPDFPNWFINELVDKSLVGKINTRDVVEFMCPVHGVYKQRVGEHIRLKDSSRISGCPLCATNLGNKGSKKEEDIILFIKSLGIDNIERHNKSILNGKEIDIYLPEIKLGIEYCGSAFHASDGNIYENKDKYYHRDKFLLARSKGIHLITIFDKDWECKELNIKDLLVHIINGNKELFTPYANIVETDNDYDIGTWLKDFCYEELVQKEPSYYTYKNFLVYRCGKTIWYKK